MYVAPPQWVTAPRAVTVRRGESLHVPCDVTGTPPPSVTWLHGDGNLLYNTYYYLYSYILEHDLTQKEVP